MLREDWISEPLNELMINCTIQFRETQQPKILLIFMKENCIDSLTLEHNDVAFGGLKHRDMHEIMDVKRTIKQYIYDDIDKTTIATTHYSNKTLIIQPGNLYTLP